LAVANASRSKLRVTTSNSESVTEYNLDFDSASVIRLWKYSSTASREPPLLDTDAVDKEGLRSISSARNTVLVDSSDFSVNFCTGSSVIVSVCCIELAIENLYTASQRSRFSIQINIPA
jgi:hypothetical protein